ncbi:MAG: hypothetical protein N3D20_00235 [Candidatus Pacearchaeota archaeon]|nr:hypothetical protein [Candidatus Pacearchaeota archaeon]
MLVKKGQVWLETVLYTLIGLVLIGMVLAFVMPKINEVRDRALVEQAISTFSLLDEKINEVLQKGAGNTRKIDFIMKKGELYFNMSNDEIVFVIKELSKPYSEPGIEIERGNMKILSLQKAKTNEVYLKLKYDSNLTYSGSDNLKKLTSASTPYKIFIENKGVVGEREWINIEEVS